jgi:hypothetical protein
LLFLHADAHGGRCAQTHDGDGTLEESRKFTTWSSSTSDLARHPTPRDVYDLGVTPARS